MTRQTVRKPILRRVARPAGELAVADYPGAEPAVIAMHGFPDRRSINEPLADHLDGRRVLLFDFLGFGDSDKPADHVYDSASFEDDLDAVVSDLGGEAVVIVAHDASGPTAINWARRNVERTERLVLLNCYYHQTESLRFPELIALFADPATRPLTTALAAEQGLMPLAFMWQGAAFTAAYNSPEGRLSGARARAGQGKIPRLVGLPLRQLAAQMRPSVKKLGVGLSMLGALASWKLRPTPEQARWLSQFTGTPSSMPAFLGWTGDLRPNLVSNGTHVDALRSFERPVKVAFGKHDPYLTPEVAQEIAELFPNSGVELLEAGHWPQLDLPERVAQIVRDSPGAQTVAGPSSAAKIARRR